MRSRGRGRIVVWQGGSLWVLEAESGFGEADFHSHHAIQITIALDGEFELKTSEETRSGPCVAVAADASHIFEAKGLIGFLFVEPESPAGRSITDRCFQGAKLAEIHLDRQADALDRLPRTFTDPLTTAELVEIGRGLVDALAGRHRAPLPDRRVAQIISHAASHLEEAPSLTDAAARFGISHSRLRHLFVEQTGLPFKTYLLWLRLTKAVEVYALGNSLTVAAHEAGFADSAHFSRTFRRTFGLPATTLTLW